MLGINNTKIWPQPAWVPGWSRGDDGARWRFDSGGLHENPAIHLGQCTHHYKTKKNCIDENKTSQASLVTAKGHRSSTGITRIDTILFALHQSGGVTLADLTVVTGWQAHSVRAALYRLQQAGHAIVSLRSGGL